MTGAIFKFNTLLTCALRPRSVSAYCILQSVCTLYIYRRMFNCLALMSVLSSRLIAYRQPA